MKKTIYTLALLFTSFYAATAGNINKNIGQVMMVGMKGTEINENSDIVRELRDYNIGGIILFPKTEKYPNQNIVDAKQLKKLTHDLQMYAKEFGLPKLLIAVNEEGGQINALKPENFPAIKQCADQGLNLSQADIGKTGDIKLAKKQSYCIAEALKEYGINVNLAPVAAIEVNPDSDVIAKWGRSYGNTEQIVTDYLKSSLDGYKKASVISVLKHFPGLGSAKDNTDFGGMVNITYTWQESEGNVYRNLISNFSVSPMIMVSFAMNTTLDESGLPAALSYNMVTKLLRKDMDYNGVIMTDDLNASAIMDYFSRKQATYLAVNAGSNMLIFGGGLGYDATKETDIFYNNLVDLYTKDSAFAKKVDTSVKYIKSLKQVL